MLFLDELLMPFIVVLNAFQKGHFPYPLCDAVIAPCQGHIEYLENVAINAPFKSISCDFQVVP